MGNRLKINIFIFIWLKKFLIIFMLALIFASLLFLLGKDILTPLLDLNTKEYDSFQYDGTLKLSSAKISDPSGKSYFVASTTKIELFEENRNQIILFGDCKDDKEKYLKFHGKLVSTFSFKIENEKLKNTHQNNKKYSIDFPVKPIAALYNFKVTDSKNGVELPVKLTEHGMKVDYERVNDFGSFKLELEFFGFKSFSYHSFSQKEVLEISSNFELPDFYESHRTIESTITKNGFKKKWVILDEKSSKKKETTFSFSMNLQEKFSDFFMARKILDFNNFLLGLTFMFFFFIEIITMKKIHLEHYFFLGFSICFFYLFLFGVLEVTDFNNAYWIATVSLTTLLTTYSRRFFCSRKLVYLFFCFQCCFHTYVFFVSK